MLLVIIGLLYILISFIKRKNYNPYLGWLVVFFVMGLQSNVPGDYDRYEETFIKIANNFENIHELRVELGWGYLNYIFSRILPFPVFVFIISFFEYIILAMFIKKYAYRKFMFLGGLVFFFWLNLMLFQMKGLRQALSTEICLLALMYVDQRKSKVPIILVILASTIHTSALLMLPIIVLAIIYTKNKWSLLKARTPKIIFPAILLSLYLLIFFFKKVFIEYIQPKLLLFDLMGYEGYFGELDAIDYNILITIYGAIVVFAVSYVMQSECGFRKYLSILFIISAFWEMFSFGAGNMFRFSLYYSITSIVVLPNVSSYLHFNKHRILAWLFALLVLSYTFRTFITQTIRHSEDGFDNYSLIIFN